jgi:hypothetical protein
MDQKKDSVQAALKSRNSLTGVNKTDIFITEYTIMRGS